MLFLLFIAIFAIFGYKWIFLTNNKLSLKYLSMKTDALCCAATI